MSNPRWICWYLLEGVPSLLAFPVDSSKPPGNDFWTLQWRNQWPPYALGLLSFIIVVLSLAGCLCCRRQRRPKGFQDDAGTGKQFKDGSTAGTETTIERVPSSSLELEVPRILTSSREKIHFDEISCNYVDTRSAIKPPSSSLYDDDNDEDRDEDDNKATSDDPNNSSSRDRPCSEWYEGENFPREKLKYLREIGRGWFGKVVEGTTIIEDNRVARLGKNRGVVVRILTEGATSREKSWFLGESTPYLKLRHPNILELLGFCLETDPYLLLFESCPVGDLKDFLIANREKGDALRKENLPTRIALNIADALEHMHENGFAHTDLAARNCLVAQDLTAKLGDYGIGVEKYPGDYYVVGDRALPIRWSAPESLECTETTIETRAITPLANVWSYGVLLWEIATWAERPYDDLGDEQIIEMIFSIKDEKSMKLLNKLIAERDLPCHFRAALEATWKFSPNERSSLSESRQILCGKRIEDFERRWENSKPNGPSSVDKSASLQDLRGSVDSELWQVNSCLDKNSLRANFRLGPDEPVATCASLRESSCLPESGSETEEESWRGRVERGAYTEKVKQKSKSVADLMILVHIDSDSDVETSLGPQNVEKTAKKRLPPSGSDGDLRSAVIADEFDEALRKLRDPVASNNIVAKVTKNIFEKIAEDPTPKFTGNLAENLKIGESVEKPKLLTLTNQGQTPILRLSFGSPAQAVIDPGNDKARQCEESCSKNYTEETSVERVTKLPGEVSRNEEHVLRLVSKGNPDLPLLRYVPERTSTPVGATESRSLDSFLALETRDTVPSSSERLDENDVNVQLWNDALAHELEKKNPSGVENSTIFDESIDGKVSYFEDSSITAVGKEGIRDKIVESGSSVPKSLQNSPLSSYTAGQNATGSLSAPATPHRDYASCTTKKTEGSKRVTRSINYYRDDEDEGTGPSSAPDTPFRGSHNVAEHDEDSSTCEELEERITVKDSAPDTPQSRGNYSVGNGDEDLSSTGEELEPGIIKRSSHEADDEEDRKHLSTPDDERSSDSGFRDKESCEEEESPIPGSQVSSIILGAKNSSVNVGISSPLSASAEEEQMRILFELDTILDAEYYGNFCDSDKIDAGEMSLNDDEKIRFDDIDEIAGKIRSISESHESTESTEILKTVRPNSCEANFLDNFFDRKDDTNDDSKCEFPNEENSVDPLENTEADSVSEFFKNEENRSSSRREDLLADSSCESPIRTDRDPSNESSVEFARLNIDSSSLRERSDGIDNSSLDTPCSDVAKNESSGDRSPIRTDRDSASTDLSSELRLGTFGDSTSSSGKTDRRNFLRDGDIAEIRKEPECSSSSADTIDRLGIPGDDDTSRSQEERTKSLSSGVESERGNCHDNESLQDRAEGSTSSIDKETSSSRDDSTKIVKRTESSTNSSRVTDREVCPEVEVTENRGNVTSPMNESPEGSGPLCDVNAELCREAEYSKSKLGQTDAHFAHRDASSSGQGTRNSSSLIDKTDRSNLTAENTDDGETSSIESPSKIGSNISAEVERDAMNSDVERWSSRENIDEINDNDEEDSSTMSLKSDNSYVSFGLDEEFVTAIRNELREKLPRAQMPVIEALDPHDEKETASINNTETAVKGWPEIDDEIEENSERSSIDISIRYNIYGTPLSPIMEERESAGTSESIVSKEESGDASIASRVSALSEDLLVVDTRTNRAIILEAGAGNLETSNCQQDDDRDTSHGDFSDDENLEYSQNHLNRGPESKRISKGSGGAPLPSPEEESKWQQQFPLPLQMQDDLMSTSFGTDRDWDSQDDEEGDEEAEEGEEEEEENSSSSGEFVWKRYDEHHGDLENVTTRSPPNKPKSQEPEVDLDEDEEAGEEEDDEEEEFTPSAWDATLAPHRSALRSPEKNLKSGDQKKSVWFKKQRYHCVYEYPKETPVLEGQGQVATTWEPTSYTDWEEMMDEPRLDIYPVEYDETNRAGDEEFYVSSSNRPFQFQSREGKYVSQFFPGARTTLLQHENQQQMSSSSSPSSPREPDDSRFSQDEVDRAESVPPIGQFSQTNGTSRGTEITDSQQQTQLGELRHTRDRLKLNLLTTSGSTRTDDESANDCRAGDLENVRKTEATAEKTDRHGKVEKTEANLVSSKEITGETAANVVEREERYEKAKVSNELDESTGKFEPTAGKMGGVEKIEDNSIIRDEATEEMETSRITERLSSDVKFCDTEIAEAQKTIIDPSLSHVVGQSTSLKILDNLAVNEASKIGSNEKEEKKVFCTEDEKATVGNRDIDDGSIDVRKSESKTRHSEEKSTREIGSTREVSKSFGDQKQESSRSLVQSDSSTSELLDIPKLDRDERTRSRIDETSELGVVASKNSENIGAMRITGSTQTSSQS